MICAECKTEQPNLIHVESYGTILDAHVCPICLFKHDRRFLREARNLDFQITEDKMNLTNKYNSYLLPIRRVEKQHNRFMFKLEEEPNWNYVFSTNDNMVIRLRMEYDKTRLKKEVK